MSPALFLRRNALKRLDDLGAEPAQFLVMGGCQALDDFLTFWREREKDFATIVRGDLAYDRGAEDQLIDDADGAVVADLQLLGEVADGEAPLGGGSANGQERLILVRGQVLGTEEVFAETQKSPHLVAERGQGLKVGRIQERFQDT